MVTCVNLTSNCGIEKKFIKMNKIVKPLFNDKNFYYFKEIIRHKGHSKWQNIKSTKEKADHEKSVLVMKYESQIRAAIAETGETNPDKNMKLAYLVEKAKKNKLPSGSIKAILERYQTQKISDKNLWIYVQGPDGCLLIFQLVTNNLHVSKARVNHHIKKCMCKSMDVGVKAAFNVEGVIISEKNCDIDAATDIAIDVGAEEVAEIEKDDKKCLKFICNPLHLMIVKNSIQKKGLEVISAEEEYVPHTFVEISEDGLEKVVKFVDRMKGTGEVVKFYDNIA